MKKINSSNIENIAKNLRTVSVIAKIDGQWFVRSSVDIGIQKSEIFERIDRIRTSLGKDFFILVPRNFLTNSVIEWVGTSLFFAKEDYDGCKQLIQEIISDGELIYPAETSVYRDKPYNVCYGRVWGERYTLQTEDCKKYVGFDYAEPNTLDLQYIQKAWYILGADGRAFNGIEPRMSYRKLKPMPEGVNPRYMCDEKYPSDYDYLDNETIKEIVRKKLSHGLYYGKRWTGSFCSERKFNGTNHHEYCLLKNFDSSWDLLLGRFK